ncbi:MaoC family dehydratase N-terminal domain-containing protein [Tsukamurella sp. M9C]|uniref:FAS1-like dehydratase domain-containing protein n=1 Tax=unclassified Tsukamurella TaxID=2633480 RepID=UPI001CCB3623|nr:MaoC family dehydratase N-terminal domain-containing protein [Tsukamurella sp. M9C]MCA0158021.1 MaoC family dehydratase N-terminal domain-containing protein [Tsukamurella sp. M9C]
MWYPSAFEVTTEGVRAFGRATRCWHTPWESLGVPPRDTPVPATLLAAPMLHAVAALVAASISSPNMSRILHAGQSYRYEGHPLIGERIDIGARITDHVQRGGADFFTVESGAVVDGETRIVGTSQIVYLGDAVEGPVLEEALVENVMLFGTGPLTQQLT